MKKLIITLGLILIIVYMSLAILGSGGEYAAEKLFHAAMKKASDIVANPDVVPPVQLASVEHTLKLLINKYPKANITKFGYLALLELYINNKRYDDGMNLTDVIKNTYTSDAGTVSAAQFAKGLIYEKQNRWDKALAEYRIIQEKYPATQLGLQMPIYIGRYYERKAMDREAKETYQEAVKFYTKIEREYSDKVIGYNASLLLIQIYLNLKDYESAGKVLEDTMHKYSSTLAFRQLLPLVENIYVQNFNAPKRAIEIYNYVLGKTRDSRLAKILKQKIKKLEENK